MGDDFFGEVEHCRGRIREIDDLVEEINSLKKEQSWNDDDAGADSRLEELLATTNQTAGDVRTRLQRLNKENKTMDPSDPDLRTRKTQLGALVKSFQSTMEKFKSAQEQYRDKYKDRVRRQARIVDPDISDQQVEQMIERGDNPQQAFANEILADARHNEAKNALVYIQEQHRDIKQLEKSIVELHQLFVDMAALVEAQQDVLDQIDKNVQSAVVATGDSYQQLVAAEQSAISARKKCCIICCIIIIVIIVIIAAIAAVVGVIVLVG